MSLFQPGPNPMPSDAEPIVANDNDALDVKGAMSVLKLGRNAVYDACARGEIPHRRIGKLLRFSRSGLRAWLAATSAFSPSARRARG
jgi:excisionase family DNA binding protein